MPPSMARGDSRRDPTDAERWRLGGLALAALLATFAVVVMGGIVRVTGSGLGCPDWPLCHGRLIPPLEFHTLLEYSHRLLTVLAGALVVALGALSLLRYRRQWGLLVLGVSPIVLLAVQAGVGGLTVLTELPSWLVTVHLGLAAVLLGVLVVATVIPLRLKAAFQVDLSQHPGKARWLPGATALGVYGLILLGAYVRGAGAAGACLTWPLCHGQLLPGFGLGVVHMVHRFATLGVGLLVIATLLQVWRARAGRPWPILLAALVAVLFVGQLFTGAALVWTSLAPFTRALHLSLGMATWAATVALGTLLWPSPALETGRPGAALATEKR